MGLLMLKCSPVAKPYRRKDSRFWWIAPWIDGRQVRQSSGETDYSRAERKLKILEGKLAANAPITARTDRDSFAALLELVRTDYTIKKRRSLYDLGLRIDNHLEPILGFLPAGKVDSRVIAEYIRKRQIESKASNASVNRELAIIKRAFRLGERSGAVSHVPYIEMLPEDNVREGYFSSEAFLSIAANACELVADIAAVAYVTGWRIQSILDLEWRNVSADAVRTVLSKNRKPVVFPIEPFPILKAALDRRRADTKEVERRKGMLIPYVFHRDGIPVRDFRGEWDTARRAAGQPGRLIHDFRRTAVRNLKRGGWTDTEIMNMVGLKTLSMLIRYNITTEEDILEKARRVVRGT